MSVMFFFFAEGKLAIFLKKSFQTYYLDTAIYFLSSYAHTIHMYKDIHIFFGNGYQYLDCQCDVWCEEERRRRGPVQPMCRQLYLR